MPITKLSGLVQVSTPPSLSLVSEVAPGHEAKAAPARQQRDSRSLLVEPRTPGGSAEAVGLWARRIRALGLVTLLVSMTWLLWRLIFA